jgi:hypothetical protein
MLIGGLHLLGPQEEAAMYTGGSPSAIAITSPAAAELREGCAWRTAATPRVRQGSLCLEASP